MYMCSCGFITVLMTDNSRFVDEHYSSLEPLFAADPVLLHDFIYLCREGDYKSLFKKIPTYLSLTWLSTLCLELRRFYQDDVCFATMMYDHISTSILLRQNNGWNGWSALTLEQRRSSWKSELHASRTAKL